MMLIEKVNDCKIYLERGLDGTRTYTVKGNKPMQKFKYLYQAHCYCIGTDWEDIEDVHSFYKKHLEGLQNEKRKIDL